MTGPELIEELRGRGLMSQRDLAARVGVGYPHISKIENGKERPSRELCHSIARALECDGERLAAMFGYLPDWADRMLREHPLLTLTMLRQCVSSVGITEGPLVEVPSTHRFDAHVCSYCGHYPHDDPCSFVAGPGQRCRCTSRAAAFIAPSSVRAVSDTEHPTPGDQ